jgi:hypothetical protein
MKNIMSAENKLWIISIPGPDDIYAAPSYEVAQLMKAAHDRSMTEWLAGQHAKGEMLYLSPDDTLAVIEECDDAELHAELLAEFKHSDWGITEDDLRNPVDQLQPTLFNTDGEKEW